MLLAILYANENPPIWEAALFIVKILFNVALLLAAVELAPRSHWPFWLNFGVGLVLIMTGGLPRHGKRSLGCGSGSMSAPFYCVSCGS